MARFAPLILLLSVLTGISFAEQSRNVSVQEKLRLLTQNGPWKCITVLGGDELQIQYSSVYSFVATSAETAAYHDVSHMDFNEAVRYDSAESGFVELSKEGYLILTPTHAQLRSADILPSAYSWFSDSVIQDLRSQLPGSRHNYRQSLMKHVGVPLEIKITELTEETFGFLRGVENGPPETFSCSHVDADELWDEFGWVDGAAIEPQK
jgi:hypothetical protein